MKNLFRFLTGRPILSREQELSMKMLCNPPEFKSREELKEYFRRVNNLR